MSRIKLIKDDITKLEIDAITNAANSSLLGGSGVDGAIHRAAGIELLEECRSLNGCPTGEAKITKGYKLSAKYVIHCVGPIWNGGNNNEDALLESCYTNALKIATNFGIKSIAFPNISTGIYSFPKNRAAKIVLSVVEKYLENNSIPEIVYFVCFDDENYNIYKNLIRE